MAKKNETNNNKKDNKKELIKDKKNTVEMTELVTHRTLWSVDEKEDLIKKTQEQEQLIELLKGTNNEQNRSFNILKDQMAEMQSAFIKMQSGQTTQPKNSNGKKYSIGCRLINGITLFSPKREVERRITYGQLEDVTEYEMDMLLKNNQVRDFLKKDVVYFNNEEDYDTFKITDRLDISDEILEDAALNLDPNKLVDQLNKWTREKKDDPVLHSIFYRFVELYTNGRIIRMTYTNRKAIEAYFRFTIDNAQLLLENLKAVK